MIGEEPRDLRRASKKQPREVDREQGVELAVREHRFERLSARKEFELDLAGKIERDERRLRRRAQAADEPAHVLGLHAVFVLQHAFDVDDGGRAVLRGADALALRSCGRSMPAPVRT